MDKIFEILYAYFVPVPERSMTIALDFDGTCAYTTFPKIEAPREDVLNKARECMIAGHIVILYTCREGEVLRDALHFLLSHGIVPHYVNENTKQNVDYWGDCRKISADIYVDDRAPGSIEHFLKMRFVKGGEVRERVISWVDGVKKCCGIHRACAAA